MAHAQDRLVFDDGQLTGLRAKCRKLSDNKLAEMYRRFKPVQWVIDGFYYLEEIPDLREELSSIRIRTTDVEAVGLRRKPERMLPIAHRQGGRGYDWSIATVFGMFPPDLPLHVVAFEVVGPMDSRDTFNTVEHLYEGEIRLLRV